jgi:putative transposase
MRNHRRLKKIHEKEIAADIRAVFNAPNDEEAKRLLSKVVKKYGTTAPELSNWMGHSVPESMTVVQFPASHRKKLRTSNMAERVNHELKRRTRLVCIFANVDSCLRLISALCAEIDEEWQTGRAYMIMQDED